MHRAIGMIWTLGALTACGNKYHFGDSAGLWEEDTGEDTPVTSSECYPQNASVAQNVYDLDTGTPYYDDDWETCMTRNAYSSAIDGVDTYIWGAEIHGFEDTIPPGDVNVYMLLRPSEELALAVWPDDALYLTWQKAGETTGGTALDWATIWNSEIDTDADWGAWNDCYPDCGWWTGTEIIDEVAAGLDICDLYDDNDDYATTEEGLEVCLLFAMGTYPPPKPPPVDCDAGSGKFMLMPSYFQDWNKDGLKTVQFKPLQETGRAPLTADANVTSIKILDDQGLDVKVMHKDQTYEFDSDTDALVATRGKNTTLPGGRTKRFTRAQLRGDLQFVSEDVVDGTPVMEANIAWTCPLASSPAPDPIAQGYMIGLDDIGCKGLKQQVVVRPELFGEQLGYATLELYGNPKTRVSAQLTFDGRWNFDVYKRGVQAKGSFSVERDTLDVDLDWLTYHGVGICDVGHYVLSKEE